MVFFELLILGGLFVAGILVVGGAAALAWTNTESFCIDCHFGIAHREPNGPGPQELSLVKAK